ncbi:YibE/F family protein [Bacillus shivajii]|uniref:YibE/F family protein n=1 Tax=Bacillus shivajii TaxID=1983719 RepID=UPI001CFB6B43|nr:YibE/F family protein [Bacillus shivajii]UCZ51533.1 YibE/F family protein [Bacillus shivajii]
MGKKRIFQLILLFIFLIYGSDQVTADNEDSTETLLPTAKVLEIVEENYGSNVFNGIQLQYQSARVEILDGQFEGEILLAVSEKYLPNGTGNDENEFWLNKNDEVVVELVIVDGEIIKSEVMSHTRDSSTIALVVVLVGLLLIFGRKQGIKSILTLGFTLFLIFKFMIPLLFAGYSPVYLAITTGSIVTIVTFIIISGLSKKTVAAILGTIGGLASAAFISILFSQLMRLTGYHSVDEQMLVTLSHDGSFDLKGILLAGIIIGAVGAIMDVAISIASSMEEVRRTKPYIKKNELLKSGMNVGKDIMGTMANTLILAYVGAALPILMMLYSYESTLSQVIHMEFLAVEILRTAAGSIGLILSIPITAIVASAFIKTKR